MLCMCGCGNTTAIAMKTDSRRGIVKGQPMKFLPNHHGKTPTKSSSVKIPEMGVAFFEKLETLPTDKAAQIVDGRLREMEKSSKRSFAERGLLLKAAEEHELWREVFDKETGGNYSSMERWIVGACPFSRSDCFAAKRTVVELKEVPIEHLLNIPRCNLVIMVKLSSKVRKQKGVLSRAESLSEKEFLAWIQENYEDQHIESTSKMSLAPTTSAKKIIEEVLEIGRWAFEVEGREETLEAVLMDWSQSPANMEGFEGMTHREAFEHAQKMMNEQEGESAA